MTLLAMVTITALIAGCFFLLARFRILGLTAQQGSINRSIASFHGWWTAICSAMPALALVGLWLVFGGWVLEKCLIVQAPDGFFPSDGVERQRRFFELFSLLDGRSVTDPRPGIVPLARAYLSLEGFFLNLLAILVVATSLICGFLALKRSRPSLPVHTYINRLFKSALMVSALAATLVTLAIFVALFWETANFFQLVALEDIFTTQWSPEPYVTANGLSVPGRFGFAPLLAGTLLIAGIAMAVAMPTGLLCAIYLTQYASSRTRQIAKPVLEVLAGIPTVIYGFIAVLVISPLLQSLGSYISLSVASESALAAGMVLGLMVIPYVSSLSDDAIRLVPSALSNASLALGATQSETIRKIILPAALPGIIGAALLAISRAVGETMIVLMAAGLAANLTANPLHSVTTVTVQITRLLAGDQSFDTAKTLSAFALGFILFLFTLAMNVIALDLSKKPSWAEDGRAA